MSKHRRLEITMPSPRLAYVDHLAVKYHLPNVFTSKMTSNYYLTAMSAARLNYFSNNVFMIPCAYNQPPPQSLLTSTAVTHLSPQ